jgi:hypothetical protein
VPKFNGASLRLDNVTEITPAISPCQARAKNHASTSPVWRVMVQFEPPLGTKNVVCTAEGCGKLYTFSGGPSGTSNLWTHVKTVHSQLSKQLSAGSSRSGDAKESAVKTYEGAADQLRQGSATTGGERKRRS